MQFPLSWETEREELECNLKYVHLFTMTQCLIVVMIVWTTDHIGNQYYKLWIFMFTLALIQSLLQTSKANSAAAACLIHQDVLKADYLTVITS